MLFIIAKTGQEFILLRLGGYELMYIVKIIFSGVNGWDDNTAVILPFKNPKKCCYFARYYTSKNDVLIKLFRNTWWFASYVGGKEIWNDF